MTASHRRASLLTFARAARHGGRFLISLRGLPWRVAVFQWRARRTAMRLGDAFGLAAATRPAKLLTLLEIAAESRHVVELGTATAWTTVSLALADPDRVVSTYDPVEQAHRDVYLRLVNESVRRRLTFVKAAGHLGPRTARPVDLLYIDSTHERDDTIRELAAWAPVLHGGSWVVFDDYGHPDYPGVKQAIAELGLSGEARGGLFVHRGAVPEQHRREGSH